MTSLKPDPGVVEVAVEPPPNMEGVEEEAAVPPNTDEVGAEPPNNEVEFADEVAPPKSEVEDAVVTPPNTEAEGVDVIGSAAAAPSKTDLPAPPNNEGEGAVAVDPPNTEEGEVLPPNSEVDVGPPNKDLDLSPAAGDPPKILDEGAEPNEREAELTDGREPKRGLEGIESLDLEPNTEPPETVEAEGSWSRGKSFKMLSAGVSCLK